MTDLGVPAGYDNSYANAINTYGQIVGYAAKGSYASQVNEAFMYSQGQWIDLGDPRGHDERGHRHRRRGRRRRLFDDQHPHRPARARLPVYRQRRLQDLNSIVGVGSGWTLQTATAINANGAILGIGSHGNYRTWLYPLSAIRKPPQGQKPGGGTTTTLQVNTSSVYGQAVTLSAMVHPASGSAGFPTGTVTFTDGTKTLGSAPVRSGIATIAVEHPLDRRMPSRPPTRAIRSTARAIRRR